MTTKKRPDAADEAQPAEEHAGEPVSDGKAEAEPEVEVAPAEPSPEDVVAQLKDQLLRLAADFDNFRKRARKEQDEVRKFGIEGILQDILPVLDNLERALSHSEGDKSPVVQGVRMVAKQFADALTRYGVSPFPTVGQQFDPERHEAVGQEVAAGKAPGTVLNELQRGYLLHDRLLRPARVVVAAAAQDDAGTDQPAGEARD